MKKVQRIDSAFEVLRVFLGIVIAYALCLVVIVMVTGTEGAKDAIFNFAIGPFTSRRRFAQVLSRMCPYMLIGCGMCFVYASGRFSVISEGIINIAPIPILYVIFATTFGTQVMAGWPKFVNQIIIIVSCALVGGLIAMIPAIGREKLGANEMVTSTIMNFVCLYLAMWVVRGYMADRSNSFLCTPSYPDNMRFTRYWGNTNLSEGIWVAIIGVIIACIIFYRTRLGVSLDDLKHRTGCLADGVIVGAQNAGGVYHTGLQAHHLYRIQHHLGGDCLRHGVSANHLFGIAGGESVYLRNGGAMGLFGNGTGGGNIDHFFTLRVRQHFGDDIPGTAHADSHQLFRKGGVHSDHACTVDQHRGAALRDSEEGFQGSFIAQVSDDHFHFLWDVCYRLVIRQNQCPYLFPLAQKLGANVRAQEACGTGQQIYTVVVHGNPILS